MKNLKLAKLNLPDINPTIFWRDNVTYIKDEIRKKELVLTPEEWVRQHFLHLLIKNLNYPKALINIEKGHQYLQQQKRTDIHIYDRTGSIYLLVECKAPNVKLSANTLQQISGYDAALDARHLAITNGMKHYVWKKTLINNKYEQLSEFPLFT
ncbi:MAG: restriction endonuclease subunit R [Flammeovirgaceae bacterium]|nr:restriction endonuclease subunit R [Flammeovirgaceae bacterium]|tara:strand:+ start:2200 stop:2658 length:459 start_codon:yes stop_codon:yes gene_type:complete